MDYLSSVLLQIKLNCNLSGIIIVSNTTFSHNIPLTRSHTKDETLPIHAANSKKAQSIRPSPSIPKL